MLKNAIIWTLIPITVLILLYNSYLKLSTSSGAVLLFTGLQLEPYGRLFLGTTELIVAFLLLYPPTSRYAAAAIVLMMLGVIIIHITKIGLALGGDYSFFAMAVIAFCCSAALTWINLRSIG